MTITTQDIEKLASLSRLKLTEEEKAKYAKEIGDILKYVDQIQEVTEGVDLNDKKGVSHKNVMRDDIPDKILNPIPEVLIDQTPEHQDNLVKVKKILG